MVDLKPKVKAAVEAIPVPSSVRRTPLSASPISDGAVGVVGYS